MHPLLITRRDEQPCKHGTIRLAQNLAFETISLVASTNTIDIPKKNVLQVLGMGVTRHSVKKGL